MSEVHETLAAITGEMNQVGLDAILHEKTISGHELCRFATRVICAAAREAEKMIPASNIEFSDEKGRRTMSFGWIKPKEAIYHA